MKKGFVIVLCVVGLILFLNAGASAMSRKAPEKKPEPKTQFDRMDKDADGSVSKAEFDEYQKSIEAAKKSPSQFTKPGSQSGEAPPAKPAADAKKPKEFAKSAKPFAAAKKPGYFGGGSKPAVRSEQGRDFGRAAKPIARKQLKPAARPARDESRAAKLDAEFSRSRVGRNAPGGNAMAGNRPGGFSRGQGFAQREGRRGQAGQRGFANRSGMNARSFARKAPGQMRGREFGGKIQRPFANRQWQRRGNRPGQESMFPGPQMRPGRTGQRGLRGSAAPQNAARSTYGRRMENRSNMQRFRQAERRGPQVRRMKNDQSRAGARKPGGQQQMTGRKSTKNQSWRKKVMPSGQAGVAKKPVREAAPKQAPKSEMKKKAPEINPKPVQPKEAETQ